MTKEEILVEAGNAHPEMFEKVASLLSLTKRLEPEFADEAFDDINEVLDTTIRLMGEYDEKVKTSAAASHAPTFGQRVGGNFVDVGARVPAILAANFLTSVATDIYSLAKGALSKSSNYKAILAQNPALADRFSPTDLKRSFATLHRFAPEFTADPTLGGHLLSAMAETPENQMNIIKTLLDSRQKFLDAKGKQFSNNGMRVDISDSERMKNAFELDNPNSKRNKQP